MNTTAAQAREHTAARVRAVVTRILPAVRADQITGREHLKDLGADSVDRVEIILALLDELGLSEPLSSFSDLPDIDALVDLLARTGA